MDRFIPSRRASKLDIALSSAHENLMPNMNTVADPEKDKN